MHCAIFWLFGPGGPFLKICIFAPLGSLMVFLDDDHGMKIMGHFCRKVGRVRKGLNSTQWNYLCFLVSISSNDIIYLAHQTSLRNAVDFNLG